MTAQPNDKAIRSSAHAGLLRREATRIVPSLIVVALFILFVVENSRTVKVTFLFWKASASLAWALILSGALGFVAGLTLAWFRARRR